MTKHISKVWEAGTGNNQSLHMYTCINHKMSTALHTHTHTHKEEKVLSIKEFSYHQKCLFVVVVVDVLIGPWLHRLSGAAHTIKPRVQVIQCLGMYCHCDFCPYPVQGPLHRDHACQEAAFLWHLICLTTIGTYSCACGQCRSSHWCCNTFIQGHWCMQQHSACCPA